MAENNPNVPSIRCPGCGQGVALPAETCPACAYNFRTGQKPGPALAGTVSGPDSGTGRNRLALLAGGAAVVIVLAFVIFFLSRGGREDAAPPPPGGGNVGGGPMTVEEIRTQSPALNPARTINRARDVAGATDRRNDELKEIGKEYTEE